ncbi:hypothetical protein ACI77E_30420, partial [Pseudomonas antarctica]
NRLDPGATLVLSSFNGDARASVVPWGGIQAGQVVWLTIINGARELKVLDGYLISEWEVTRGLMDKPVSRDWIKGVPNNTSVEVKLYVGQTGSTNIATATASPSTFYTVGTMLRPPVISKVLVASTGASLANGGRYPNAQGIGVIFYGTCDALPFARALRVGQLPEGGHIFTIPAGVTSWQQWVGPPAIDQWITYYAVEHQVDPTVRSNPFTWSRSR